MKKTIFILALGLGTICLTSCSRGYGCPYTMESKIQNHERKTINSHDSKTDIKEVEVLEAEVVAK